MAKSSKLKKSHKKSYKRCKDCKQCKNVSIGSCLCTKKSCKCYKLKIKKMFGAIPASNTHLRGF
jgi:hypothetical protein